MTYQPYHEHELAIQNEVGERGMAARNAAVIGDSIPPSAIPFLSRQRFVVIASVDLAGYPWASMVYGEQGFLASSADGSTLTIDLEKVAARAPDPLWTNLAVGATTPMYSATLAGVRLKMRSARWSCLTSCLARKSGS